MIVNNANLVTLWPSQPFVEGALVAIEGKTIVDFGKVGKLVDRYDDADVLDVSGRLVMPGMVNAHTELYPEPAMKRIESFLDEETLYWSSLAAVLDAVRSGVTTIFLSISAPAAIEGSLAVVRRAFDKAGARGALSHVVSSRSPTSAVLRENLRHLEACRGSGSERIQGLVGLEVTGALDEEVLSKVTSASREAGAWFHALWRAEGNDEAEAWGRLGRAGMPGSGGILAARGSVPQEREGLLRDSGVFLAHGAQCDIVAGVESLDLQRSAACGVATALGTGGCGQSVSDELRVASYRQRARGVALDEAIRLCHRAAFEGGAALATGVFGRELGRIKPGARADLVVLDYWPSGALVGDRLPELFFWEASRAAVNSVIVNGRLLYKNGSFTGLDEERARARAREATTKLRGHL